MGFTIRMAIGIIGIAISVLFFTSPILTFSRIIKKKSTQEFSCIPYILTLFNTLLYTWYALPIVSRGWENITFFTINVLGFLLETCFVLIFFWFSLPKEKVKVAALTVTVVALFVAAALISAFSLHNHHQRKVFIGSVGMVTSIAQFGSPLVAVKNVIATKNVEFMPFFLSFFTFLGSCLWAIYGLLSHDFFIMSPNLVGTILGILQLIIYWKYKDGGTQKQTNKLNLENKMLKHVQEPDGVTKGVTENKS